jgi:signal transduction histidine kinase
VRTANGDQGPPLQIDAAEQQTAVASIGRQSQTSYWPKRGVADRLIDYVGEVVLGGLRQVEANIVPVALCGAIMFPAYWLVWKYLYPQPYENLPLRLVAAALCLLLVAKDWWPARYRAYFPIAVLVAFLYTMPFFFTFMLLQNNGSEVWVMSMLAALFLMVLLIDWISLLTLCALGALLGWRAHVLLSPETAALDLHLEFVPIFLFALIAGMICNYQAGALRMAAERARREIGALIASEMQSPLFAIRTQTASLSKFLPQLAKAYLEPRDRAGKSDRATEVQLRALERAPAKIGEAADQIDSIIDILLVQGGQFTAASEQKHAVSIATCLDEAIARLPLASDLDRARIIFRRERDFRTAMPKPLITHVLARVLEASFNAICDSTNAELAIDLGQAGQWSYIRLTDSSVGLRPAPVTSLRLAISRGDRRFAGRPDLAFAHLVMQHFGGSVSRTIDFGRTSEIVLWFPAPP